MKKQNATTPKKEMGPADFKKVKPVDLTDAEMLTVMKAIYAHMVLDKTTYDSLPKSIQEKCEDYIPEGAQQ